MVAGFATTCAISTYHHLSCEFQSHSWQDVLNTTLCDKVYQWFTPGTPVSSPYKTDRHDITEILLKVALNTINQTKPNQSTYGNISQCKMLYALVVLLL
jgi:hypothetical protein